MSEITIIMTSLLAMGLIGSIDEFFYHFLKEKLIFRPESFLENILHNLRLYVYGILFFVTANYDYSGLYAQLMFGVLIFDAIIGIWDIFSEEKSREGLGGIKNKEYLLHMLLSFNLGILYFNYIPRLLDLCGKETFINSVTREVSWLQWILSGFGIISMVLAVLTSIFLIKSRPKR